MIDDLKKHFRLYKEMLVACLETLVQMFNAKFVFFSSVALTIGTIGIWVPVAFNLDLDMSKVEQKKTDETTISKVANLVVSVPPEKQIVQTATDQPLALELSGSSSVEIENFSIFMYVIGILGILAAEHFIKERKIETDVQDATLTFSMFIWFIALALAFWALKEPKSLTWHLCVSCWLAVSLWLSYTVKKADFNGNFEQTKKQLRGIDDRKSSGFSGRGLE